MGLVGVLGAQAAALTANRALLIVVPWLAMTDRGNPAHAGLVGVCHTLPYVVTQVLGGPLIDRCGPRTVAGFGDLISAAAITVLAVSGPPPLWLLAITMACVGAVDGPAATAKTVWLPAVTAAAGRPVEFGSGHATAVERTATTLGPIGAGLLLAGIGPRVLWLVAGLFTVAAVISATNRGRRLRHETGHSSGYLRQLRDGSAFLHRERSLRALVLMYLVTNGLDQLFLTILLPAWAQRHGHGPALTGLAAGIFGGGAVVTALLTASIGHRLPPRPLYLITSPLGGVSRLLVVAAGADPAIVLAVFAVAGLGSGTTNVILDAAQIRLIPEHLQGRVRALINAWAWLGIPLGSLTGAIAGTLLTAALPATLWTCAGAYLIAVLYPGWHVRWPTPAHTGQAATTAAPRQRPDPVPNMVTAQAAGSDPA
nr:MFS transporter [Actinoplanes flavus]